MAAEKKFYKLKNSVQHYKWGSKEYIGELLGIKSGREPMAELWMGAHPGAPSYVIEKETELSLIQMIEQQPEFMLGPRIMSLTGKMLPFLFKVIAAEQALSVQAHPPKKFAESGFKASAFNKY